VPSDLSEFGLERTFVIPKKRFSAEQMVTLLRQIEVATSRKIDPDSMPHLSDFKP
jgi:hypothetical protein